MATKWKSLVESICYINKHNLHLSRLWIGLQQKNQITWLQKEAVIFNLANEYSKLNSMNRRILWNFGLTGVSGE